MYTFKIKDYHAIKDAVIKIDGITVLAGINGSGKSTLSRWLYYLVNSIHDFEKYQRRYFIESLEQEIEKVQRVFRTTSKNAKYQSIRAQLRRLKSSEEFDGDTLNEVYYTFLEKAEGDLRDYSLDRSANERLIIYLLGKDTPEDMDVSSIIETYLQWCRDVYDNAFQKYLQSIESCNRKDLEHVIIAEYSDGEPIPLDIELLEGELPLLESTSFTPPLMLNRAIYIDSPMAVSGRLFYHSKGIWEDFHHFLYTENSQKDDLSIERLRILIQSIIGGDIQLTDDKFELDKELHYISREQGIDININDAATGVKTFAYISQLLMNGWLDKNTILLIDEPEAHLHPQWIVEFARLLVMIHKELGVKVLIASHNPDMVAAIHAIAQKESVLDRTVFYLAQKKKDEVKYEFVNKETDISDIFASFNIALSRIEMYGVSVL